MSGLEGPCAVLGAHPVLVGDAFIDQHPNLCYVQDNAKPGLGLTATHIREYVLILTTGQTLAISGCWRPFLLTLMDTIVWGGGTTECVPGSSA